MILIWSRNRQTHDFEVQIMVRDQGKALLPRFLAHYIDGRI